MKQAKSHVKCTHSHKPNELLKSANFKVGYTLCSLLNYIMISVSWNASDFETVSFLLAFGFCVFLCGADQSDSLIQIFPV